MGPEAKTERAVVKWWKALGYECIKQKKRGWPDHLFIGPYNCHVHIEFKTPVGRLSKLQIYIIQRLRGLKCKVYVAKSIESTKEILREELATARVSAQRDKAAFRAGIGGTAV